MASSYDLLHRSVQRWVREQGWTELRQVQDQAIRAILGGDTDVLIAAATAAGKTEAAFLPLLGRAAERQEGGISILYIAPLKALINDQARRLGGLCDDLNLPLVRWHGDAPTGPKQQMRRSPRGVVLITPESIEAMLIRRPAEAQRMFAALDAIVIDELHAFLRGPRGLHLAALLRRIDALCMRSRRIGLSATIGDPHAAAAWLRPDAPDTVSLIEVEGGQPELRFQVRGYAERASLVGIDSIDANGLRIDGEADALSAIADHVWRNLRDTNNLLFAGSRRNVEELADRLRRRSDEAAVPNAFLPHHGNLSRELREEVEARLKDGAVPTTAVATTTLELGIDIGSVTSIAQLGSPRSLAGLRQRLGRSGRRAEAPAVLRIYVREAAVPADLLDRLRLPTVRAVAAVRLLLARFVEPPERHDPALLSVAVQQILSLIVERGGIVPVALHRALFASPPLALAPSDLAALLRTMADPEAGLIEQAPDGLLMLGREGERITTRRDFYANFETDEEWTLVAGGRALGTIPIANAVAVGGLIGFAGRRWRITAVDDRSRVVQVTAHPAGRLPMFENGSAEPIHDRLAAEMRTVLEDNDAPRWLDDVATGFLTEGRAAWDSIGTPSTGMVEAGRTTHLLTWRGTSFNALAAVLFVAGGLHAEAHDAGVAVEGITPGDLVGRVPSLLSLLDIQQLSKFVEALRREKYDSIVPEALLRSAWATRHTPLLPQLGAFLRSIGGMPAPTNP